MVDIVSGYVFYEIAALLVLAAAIGFVGLLLRQPLIVSFIAVGVLAGPSVLDVAQSDEYIDLLAELGIAILLFLVGLKLDLKLVRTLGAVALTTGLGQVVFTSAFGFLIALALGFDWVTAVYIGVALTFSSTIIIVKLLSDKKEIDALHGRIALGFLIVQDLVVVMAMIVLSAVAQGQAAGGASGTTAGSGAQAVAMVFVYGVALVGAVLVFIRYIATPLIGRMARSPELLIAFAIGWAALLAAVGHYLGFGKELGGLLAGVSLASTPFREAIAARLAALRDFLLLFFFISLGAALDLSILGENAWAAIVFSLFVLIGNPLIVLAIMGAMGYRARTGFLAGLTVAQISEFSLIFMAMGLSLGHVTQGGLGLVTLVGLITIAASTYMITYSHWLYERVAPFLGVFERKGTPRETEAATDNSVAGPQVLVFGLGRYGGAIAQRLQNSGQRVLGVDFNPVAVKLWREQGLDVVYGDATDPEFLAHLPLKHATHAVASMPEHTASFATGDPRALLAGGLRAAGFAGQIAAVCHHAADRAELEAAGATLLLEPFQDAADRAVELILGEASVERIDVMDPLEQENMPVARHSVEAIRND
ncbi:cation:proton antiporter family protein [Pyruvatibacter sp.]|uniref:cation:proton antiporter n=1 Tax=Pyruvatibacter sp. TaxID=1981328 RepID=UPI0032ECCC49